MLILTRRPGQSIRINENVKVSVLGIREGAVSLGIEAPKHVVVDREEVYERKLAEARASSLHPKRRN